MEVAENISTVVENRISPTTIYAVVDDEEQARSVIRSAIEGHPVFSQNFTKAMISRSA